MARQPPARTKPWSPSFWDLFDLASRDWHAPDTIVVRDNARRTRMSVQAVFVRPDGVQVRMTARLLKDAEGGWTQVAETLRIRATLTIAGAPV